MTFFSIFPTLITYFFSHKRRLLEYLKFMTYNLWDIGATEMTPYTCALLSYLRPLSWQVSRDCLNLLELIRASYLTALLSQNRRTHVLWNVKLMNEIILSTWNYKTLFVSIFKDIIYLHFFWCRAIFLRTQNISTWKIMNAYHYLCQGELQNVALFPLLFCR